MALSGAVIAYYSSSFDSELPPVAWLLCAQMLGGRGQRPLKQCSRLFAEMLDDDDAWKRLALRQAGRVLEYWGSWRRTACPDLRDDTRSPASCAGRAMPRRPGPQRTAERTHARLLSAQTFACRFEAGAGAPVVLRGGAAMCFPDAAHRSRWAVASMLRAFGGVPFEVVDQDAGSARATLLC